MLKKIIIPVICVVIVGLSILGYVLLRNESVSSKTDIYISIPGEPFAVFQINNLKDFEESLLYNNNYWLNLTPLKAFNRTHIVIAALDSLKESNPDVMKLITGRSILVAAYTSQSGDANYLLTTQMPASGYETSKKIFEKYVSEPVKQEYYKEFLLASSSQSLIDEAKKCIDANASPILSDEIFRKARLSAGNKQEANIFINIDRCQQPIKKSVREERERLFQISRQYDSWCGYDVDFSEDKIEVNGFAYCKDGGELVAAFQNQNTEHNTLSAAMPYNTFFFRHFALSNLEDYRQLMFPDSYSFEKSYDENYDELTNESDSLETTSGENPETFMQEFFGGEIALGYSPLDVFVLVKLMNSSEAAPVLDRIATALNPKSKEVYQGVTMYHLGTTGFAGSVFGDYFTLYDEYLCIAGGNLIIAPTQQLTAYIATRNPKTQTLQCSPVFRSADRTLLSTSNRSIYIDIPYIVRNASKFFNEDMAASINEHRDIWSAFDCIGLQSENEGRNMDYQHIFIQYSGERGEFAKLPDAEPQHSAVAEERQEQELIQEQEQVQEPEQPASTEPSYTDGKVKKLFTVQLDAPASIKPQIFTNHYTGENEIFIQDEKNNIYLFSASGKTLWKTSVKERIIGGIKSVDILNNKKLQIAFVTKSRLYVIDRNGKMVSGYPIDLQGGVCTPLGVFDYEGKKDYRFAYGTVDNKAHIVKKDGKALPEWKSVRTKSNIDGEMKHFRINGKDYIVYADADKCYLLDRKANVRLQCGASLIKSAGNGIYTDISGNKLVISLSNGKICFVTTADNATSTQLKKYGEDHSFVKSGNCYFFGYSKGFDAYDSDLNLLYSDNPDVSALDASGGVCGAWSKGDGNLYIYSKRESAFTRAAVKAASGLFTIAPVKPVASTAAIVCNGNVITAYKVQ